MQVCFSGSGVPTPETDGLLFVQVGIAPDNGLADLSTGGAGEGRYGAVGLAGLSTGGAGEGGSGAVRLADRSRGGAGE